MTGSRSTQTRTRSPVTVGSSHVPQNPWRHEYAMPGTVSRRTSSVVRSAGTSSVTPLRASSTRNGLPPTIGGVENRSKNTGPEPRSAASVRTPTIIGTGPQQ